MRSKLIILAIYPRVDISIFKFLKCVFLLKAYLMISWKQAWYIMCKLNSNYIIIIREYAEETESIQTLLLELKLKLYKILKQYIDFRLVNSVITAEFEDYCGGMRSGILVKISKQNTSYLNKELYINCN